MKIDRCICFQQTFLHLRKVAEETCSESLQELQTHVEFGKGCTLCHPYVRRMLRTGETIFADIITERDEP